MKDIIYNHLEDGGAVRLEYVSGKMSSVIKSLDHLLGIDDAGIAFQTRGFSTKSIAVPWSNIERSLSSNNSSISRKNYGRRYC